MLYRFELEEEQDAATDPADLCHLMATPSFESSETIRKKIKKSKKYWNR